MSAVRAEKEAASAGGSEETGLLHDYKLERWLSSSRRPQPVRRAPSLSAGGQYDWAQRVQYAVGHAVNRYYSAEPELRGHADAGELVDYRWPRRMADFESEKSYWELKDSSARHLQSFFVSNGYEGERPVMLYERFETRVPELEIDMSMIFQVAWQGKGEAGLHLQKFVVERDSRVLEGYRHAARVFCRQAFGADPAKIEVYQVLRGERIELSLNGVSYEQSIDYLRLAYAGMEEESQERSCTCGQCRPETEAAAGFLLC
ncbi:hypothetical protein [Saccharibacillus alkalitolerans]|uniref:Uncharacterized protein n=1 Tax=Saccharibacillus alkalitolerans TaxID=2705290 RepID=A0ABX0F1E3_9BACL|nr:hypothetical protein [Saccharibacillus alkalitolerans]NGZ74330.1 hypothetical protein [Saccharibacillus alkalitolerans]